MHRDGADKSPDASAESTESAALYAADFFLDFFNLTSIDKAKY